MAGVTLREATEEDAESLAAIVRAAFAEYRGVLEPPSGAHDETGDGIRRKLATMSAVVAEVDGVPIGCVFYEHRADHTYLGRLAVLPEHRGRGIGAALIEAVEVRAVEAGKEKVRLGVRLALAENHAYYARRGYQDAELGTHPGCSAPTFVFMEKLLTI